MCAKNQAELIEPGGS